MLDRYCLAPGSPFVTHLRASLTPLVYFACVLLAELAFSGSVEAAVPEKCEARLEVKLTPDVRAPRDPSFLSALAANPLYTLIWTGGNDTTAVYELTGPATDYHCEDEIKRLRRDAHVMRLEVLQPDADKAVASRSMLTVVKANPR